MEKVERASVAGTNHMVLCKVLNDQGRSTGELIVVPPRTMYHIQIVPWAPVPLLTEPVEIQSDLHADDQIWFVREDNSSKQCTKWTYYAPDEIDARFNHVYRLVRVTDDATTELWRNNPSCDEPRWRQILTMSGHWPRLPDGSDELSIVYRDANPAMATPSRGCMFQMFVGESWIFCQLDLRAPIEEVPDALR